MRAEARIAGKKHVIVVGGENPSTFHGVESWAHLEGGVLSFTTAEGKKISTSMPWYVEEL